VPAWRSCTGAPSSVAPATGYRESRLSVGEPFSIALDRSDPVVVLTARGEVDASAVPVLAGALDRAIADQQRHVVIDAAGITFIDSTGVSCLVSGMRRLNRTRRRLAVACRSDSPLGRALEMTGLDHSFDIHATVDGAVAALASAPLLGR
jgi:anti-sigma B factor antagonist